MWIWASRLVAPTGITMWPRVSHFSVLMNNIYKYLTPPRGGHSASHGLLLYFIYNLPSSHRDSRERPSWHGWKKKHSVTERERDVRVEMASDILCVAARQSRVLLHIFTCLCVFGEHMSHMPKLLSELLERCLFFCSQLIYLFKPFVYSYPLTIFIYIICYIYTLNLLTFVLFFQLPLVKHPVVSQITNSLWCCSNKNTLIIAILEHIAFSLRADLCWSTLMSL